MKLKDCPLCGWKGTGVLAYSGTDDRHSVLCSHCGYQSRKSRFRRTAKLAWNRENSRHEKKRYHLYGREY